MDKRIFISYKYPEGNRYRDKLIKKLENGSYKYLGETNKSKDISLLDDAAIGSLLSDKIYSTHVTVILISPSILDSDWIPWEVSYSLRVINRANRNSSRNGVVAIVIPDQNGSYDYAITKTDEGNTIHTSRLPGIIGRNMFNATDESRHETTSKEFGSYISMYRWNEFCNDLNEIIDTAYTKSQTMTHLFDITTWI
ncbi:MAG: hypothetical protein KQ78_01322 [Candidatus Izimaplasma bacterium HR2]|nr:MAG: hypothetical protein KQ78_01322 [Candidatus Izimaplasma bacterium HR2]